MAFSDALNIFSGLVNSNIQILLKEETLNLVEKGSFWLVNISNLTISSYSDKGLTGKKAALKIVESLTIPSYTTSFSLPKKLSV